MTRQTRSDMRRLRARRAMRSRPAPTSPLDLPRAAFGTTARITPAGEQFLTEPPELYRQHLSPYNPARWIGTDGATTRGYLALAESNGWPRRGMIAPLAIMLVGAALGIAQMAGALGERNGAWGMNFLSGLVIGGPLVLVSFATVRRLLRPAAGRS